MIDSKIIQISDCKQCGICCRKGGPALHLADKSLIDNGFIIFEQITTIRKGERVIKPFSSEMDFTDEEFLKIMGQKKSWTCLFYNDKESICAIHKDKPLECQAQKCWDTTDIMEIQQKEKLKRYSILSGDSPFMPIIKQHEKDCSWTEINSIIGEISDSGKGKSNPIPAVEKLGKIMNQDLQIRNKINAEYDLSLGAELFYLGRPIFHVLKIPNFQISAQFGQIRLVPNKN
jgi:Fe-S-cluster containining protein